MLMVCPVIFKKQIMDFCLHKWSFGSVYFDKLNINSDRCNKEIITNYEDDKSITS